MKVLNSYIRQNEKTGRDTMVKENLRNVEERVAKACLRSGRKREDVTLIAVSKTKPVSMIEEVPVSYTHLRKC